MVYRMKVKNLLRNLQGSYLRATVGSIKTTPTGTLEVASLTLCQSNLNPYCLGRKAAFFSVGI
jgi:hypothetical protein